MNVLILMAGNDDIFREAGYAYPKNLIEIGGSPLLEHVVRNLDSLEPLNPNYIFLVRKEEIQKSHTASVVHLLLPDAKVLGIPGATGGAACTALWAVDHIDNQEPLLIVNGDQLLDVNYAEIIRGFRERKLDGGIVVFEAVHPRWSYVKVNEEDLVIETAEKRPISKLATAGTYYFARGADFVAAVKNMILKEASVDGSFYVCPAYNELILKRARIGVQRIAKAAYAQLKTPRAVTDYEHQLESRSVREHAN